MEYMTVRELTAHMSISPNEEWAISGAQERVAKEDFLW